ncbi:MAG: DNA adenine methylase, partial [Bacteroidota bacterium]
STWLSNKYRVNEYVFSIWKDSFIATKEHFYHVGAKEENRNAVYEALVSNVRLPNSILTTEMQSKISNNDSQLTSIVEKKKEPTQLLLNL